MAEIMDCSKQVHSLNVCGLMSGTSADAIDVAIVRCTLIEENSAQKDTPRVHLELLKYTEVAWRDEDRSLLLRLMNPERHVTLRELGRANVLVGRRLGEAVNVVASAAESLPGGENIDLHSLPDHIHVDVIASHGQTLHHDPPFSSMQIGIVLAAHSLLQTTAIFLAPHYVLSIIVRIEIHHACNVSIDEVS